MNIKFPIIAISLILFSALIIVNSPETAGIRISGTIKCADNAEEMLPGNITQFLLNVTVVPSGMAEDFQGIRVDLEAECTGLDINLSEDVLYFEPHGGVKKVTLHVVVPDQASHGTFSITVSGTARAITGPITGIIRYNLGFEECFVNVTRVRGTAFSCSPRSVDVFRGETAKLNLTCENLGNAAETATLVLREPISYPFFDIAFSSSALILHPHYSTDVLLTTTVDLEAPIGEYTIAVLMKVENDPRGLYSREVEFKIRTMILPEPPGKPFEAKGDPNGLEITARDIHVVMYYSNINIFENSIEIKVMGRSSGSGLRDMKLFLVHRSSNDDDSSWIWSEVAVTEMSPGWKKWDADAVLETGNSPVPGALLALGDDEDLHIVAVGTDQESMCGSDMITKKLGDIREGSTDPEITDEKEEDGGVFGMNAMYVMMIIGAIFIVGLLLVIGMARVMN